MKLVIYRNGTYEEEKALVDFENETIIVSGDYYHDKIDEYIDGYLGALSDHNIYTEEVETVDIYPGDLYFTECAFYDNAEDID